MTETARPHSRPLRIWALLGPRTGDNKQVLALAEAVAAEAGGAVERIGLRHNALRLLPPGLLGAGVASLDRASRARLVPPWPDLVIGVGRRGVPAARWIRARSDGRARLVQIGRPRLDPALLDLVLTTPQYGVPPGPTVLELPLALTPHAPARAGGAAPDGMAPDGMATVEPFPPPRHALLLGGPTWPWRPDEAAVERACRALIARAAAEGGSVLAIASRRTPAALAGRVRDLLAAAPVPAALLEGGENPYPALLALADSVAVTADSVAMVSDAVAGGRPVTLLPLRAGGAGDALLRAARALRLADAGHPAPPALRLLGRGWGGLVRRGLAGWPRDLWFFWRGLEHHRLAQGDPAPPAAPDVMAAAVARIRRLLPAPEAGSAPGGGPPGPSRPAG